LRRRADSIGRQWRLPQIFRSSIILMAQCNRATVLIVAKLAGQKGFQVLPRRWVVERTLAWISRCRRTVRDYERRPEHHAAFVQWSMIIIRSRRLARYQP
jgi:putative transposase